MSTAAIDVHGLTKHYGSTVALDGLDLEVARGTIFGFLGPNGSGKTTAMRTLVGLTRPTSGTVQVLGFDAVTQGLDVRRRIGYLAQLPQFHDDLSPRRTLWFARRFFPMPDVDAARREVEEALDLVGLRTRADSLVGNLSGGQRQRLGIAQAAVHRPQLLILDEPASALDPVGRRDVLDIMRALRGDTTVFFSTHILDDVERVSDEVAIVDAGRRVTQAPIDTLLAGDEHPTVTVTLRGDGEAAARRLRGHSWVTEVTLEASPAAQTASPGTTSAQEAAPTVVHVATRDAAAAEHQLLRVVLEDPDVSVLEVRTHRIELEEAFLRHLTPTEVAQP